MTVNDFVIGILVLLFGYNYLITKWIKRQEKKLRERRAERELRRWY